MKGRRQSNPTKPKKMMKVDPLTIVDAACNNGTTALVTKDGSLLMYGKDYLYSNEVTGLVDDLKEVFVERVSLGKAHAAVLTNKGHLYTFGINNKGQCGRDFITCCTTSASVTATIQPANKDTTIIAMETGAVEDELIITEQGKLFMFYYNILIYHYNISIYYYNIITIFDFFILICSRGRR